MRTNVRLIDTTIEISSVQFYETGSFRFIFVGNQEGKYRSSGAPGEIRTRNLMVRFQLHTIQLLPGAERPT